MRWRSVSMRGTKPRRPVSRAILTVAYQAPGAFLLNGQFTPGAIDLGGDTFDVAPWAKNRTRTAYNRFDFRVAGRNTTTRYNDPRPCGLGAHPVLTLRRI